MSLPSFASIGADDAGSYPGNSASTWYLPGANASTLGLDPRAPRSLRSMYSVAPAGSVRTRSTATLAVTRAMAFSIRARSFASVSCSSAWV